MESTTTDGGKTLTERLIEEVKRRPVLWNRKNDYYNNRVAMEKEWVKLAKAMKYDNIHFLRQKWKNLRDHFKREFNKVKPYAGQSSKSTTEYYEGKWIYFEKLLFIKDSLRTRTNKHTLVNEVEVPEQEIKEELIVYDEDSVELNCEESYNNSEPEVNTTIEYDETPRIWISNVTTQQPNESEIEKSKVTESTNLQNDGRKRKVSESSNTSEESHEPIKRKKKTEDPNDIDDDLLFVKSLVPFLRKLNPVRKLVVRNEIQNILLRENLCNKCSGRSCSDS